MKKSLSLVVALALVFSLLAPAMAFAATSQETAAGNELKDLGVLTGNSQGDLLLDNQLDREDMIVLLSRLLDAEEEAAAYENTHGWSDVQDPFYDSYISWAMDNGYTNGVGDGSLFGYDRQLTVQELLQFMLRALGYTDVAWNDVPAKAQELGLAAANENMTAVATRGKMAVVTLATLETPVNGANVTLGAKLGLPGFADEVAIASFKAVGRKKLEVTFTTAVDKDKANISLKRGANSVSVAEYTWNDAKTAVTLELASNLIEATYEVTVTGLSEEALTASTETQAERVASIEILGDVAPLKREVPADDDDDGILDDTVEVRYLVKNQYGEDYNSAPVDAKTTAGNAVAEAGVVTIERSSGDFSLNEYIVLTLISIEDTQAVTTTKTLQVGQAPKVTELAIVDLYNEDDKTLNEKSDPEDFYIIVEAKDQYGYAFTNEDLLSADVIVNFTGLSNLSIEGYSNRKADFTTVTVDGSDKTALQLTKDDDTEDLREGDSYLLLVAPNGGKSVNYTVHVAAATKVDSIDLQTPAGIVAEAEEVKVPVFAYDRDGNLITDVDVISEVTISFSDRDLDDEDVTFVEEDNNVFMKFTTPEKANGAYGALSIQAFTPTNKVEVLTLNIREKAYPRVITGLKSDVNKLIFEGEELTIAVDKVLAEDNYGRAISDLAAALGDNYLIKAELSGSGDAVTVVGDVYINSDNSLVLLGNDQGKKNATFSLVEIDEDDEQAEIKGSQYTVQFRTVELAEIERIEIEEVAAVFAGDGYSSYTRDVKVSGYTKDGMKVTVPSDYYSLIPSTSDLVVVDDTKVQAADKLDKDATVTIRVVLTNGKDAEREVTLSTEAPKVASIKIGDGKAEQTVAADTLTFDDLVTEIKDQYGATVDLENLEFLNGAALPPISVTFSDFEGDVVSNNGKDNAQIDLDAGKSAVVTIKIGNVTATAKIKAE
mgnify:CR=1 FL=1